MPKQKGAATIMLCVRGGNRLFGAFSEYGTLRAWYLDPGTAEIQAAQFKVTYKAMDRSSIPASALHRLPSSLRTSPRPEEDLYAEFDIPYMGLSFPRYAYGFSLPFARGNLLLMLGKTDSWEFARMLHDWTMVWCPFTVPERTRIMHNMPPEQNAGAVELRDEAGIYVIRASGLSELSKTPCLGCVERSEAIRDYEMASALMAPVTAVLEALCPFWARSWGSGALDSLRDQWCLAEPGVRDKWMIEGLESARSILMETGLPSRPAEALMLATSPLFAEAYRGTLPLTVDDECHMGEGSHVPFRVSQQSQLRLDLYYCAAVHLNSLGVFPRCTYVYTSEGPLVIVGGVANGDPRRKRQGQGRIEASVVGPRRKQGNLPYTLPRGNVLVSAGKLGETLLYAVHTADEPLRCEVPVTQYLRLAFKNNLAHLYGSIRVPFYRPVVHKSWETRTVRDAEDSKEDPRGLVRLDTFFQQELIAVATEVPQSWLLRSTSNWI
ncbi:protein ORF69 [Cyprinid herpesvirus 1]|uniref:Protein ORF69 n=1 Tax=Cyprinid herpesvirus 1 TaxID=317858 RepID=K7PBL4_9VIRU|nr:protein ORF69 [Cyprinid herpesvirus 1]AFJ20366.1 protein ORF69 [Cyprinid herpesvirus 1]